ncbi:MAG: hypothetical protein HQL71_01970 [Magnetococcales bacterium]|nr:hypothetical protein [Magnetococcales bacterium]
MRIFLSIAAMFTVLIGISTMAYAECAVSYTRTACRGQDATSYKKCGGNKSCTKIKKADTMHACWQAAVKSCNNGRLDITKYKQITATYNGRQLIGGFAPSGHPSNNGTNFCWGGRPDLNQCQ